MARPHDPRPPVSGHGTGVLRIPLTMGFFALIDEADGPAILRYVWHAKVNGRTVYARRNLPTSEGRGFQHMHSAVLGLRADDPSAVDHANLDGLDNRRSNLRLATKAQNGQNSRLRSDNTTGLRGVKRNGRQWMARASLNGVVHYLGCFQTKEAAAHAYDEFAIDHFGAFARLNFPAHDYGISNESRLR